jgi:4,5-DOPA dioxygenase extradiol
MLQLPTLFVSHGSPTFAIEPGLAGAQLAAAGRALARPGAVLVVSPHWTTREARVGVAPRPSTMHDFGGFDPVLYTLSYPAPGHPALAMRAAALLAAAGWAVRADAQRGLDHGAWVPLRHLYPDADVPVFQVSMPASLDAAGALTYGEALSPLADESVMIVGSGSLTHNLEEFFRPGVGEGASFAAEFQGWIRDAVRAGDRDLLARALDAAPHARHAHPTTEHFLPLLVALGAARAMLPATVLPGGILHGMLSMESYVFGAALRDVPLAAPSPA